jgi:hypothetical protein
VGDVAKRTPPEAATYGLCNAPQNAEAFPSTPLRVQSDQCFNFQKVSATSNMPSPDATCGGFTMALGPLGDLKPHLQRVKLSAEWGDVALSAENCASASLAAVGWGARCSDDACTSAKWEKIGGPQQRAGTWNTASQVCYLGVTFTSTNKKYKTLNLDVIATLVESGESVRKRAKGTIRARVANGKCSSLLTSRARLKTMGTDQSERASAM